VPYVLPAGLWILAVLTTITLGQRVWAVREGTAAAAAKDKDKDEAAGAPARDDGADRAGQGTGPGGGTAGQAKG